MKSEPRGLCLIISNINFNNVALSTRFGGDLDVERLKHTFEKLNFIVEIKSDKTAEEMAAIFDHVRNRDLSLHDAFVCVVMSHGSKGDVIYGVDGNFMTVHEISKLFNDQYCLALRGKPKLFFISACRGSKCMH